MVSTAVRVGMRTLAILFHRDSLKFYQQQRSCLAQRVRCGRCLYLCVQGLGADYSGCRSCNSRKAVRASSSLPQFIFSERPFGCFLGGPSKVWHISLRMELRSFHAMIEAYKQVQAAPWASASAVGYSFSNSDLARPDWRMTLWSVPRLRVSCIGTGTVTVVPSVCNCMIR